jgi:hypothetical protein
MKMFMRECYHLQICTLDEFGPLGCLAPVWRSTNRLLPKHDHYSRHAPQYYPTQEFGKARGTCPNPLIGRKILFPAILLRWERADSCPYEGRRETGSPRSSSGRRLFGTSRPASIWHHMAPYGTLAVRAVGSRASRSTRSVSSRPLRRWPGGTCWPSPSRALYFGLLLREP